MQISSKNPWMRLLATITVVLVFAVAWYLISPLFIDRQVSEGFPTLAHMPTKTAKAIQSEAAAIVATAELGFQPAEATAAMETAEVQTPSEASDSMPDNEGAQMIVLASGDFYDIAHVGMGVATIYELADGSRVLRFENFEVLNGPDLHVYLAADSIVPNTTGEELKGALDLGELKGNLGDQNYSIPSDVVLENFRSVVIWCVPFRVPFNAATLN
jgi:hypothetical protein